MVGRMSPDRSEAERDAFVAGAEAMRSRVLAGIRRWWDAPKSSRYRPSHPHWLEVAIVKLDALALFERRDA